MSFFSPPPLKFYVFFVRVSYGTKTALNDKTANMNLTPRVVAMMLSEFNVHFVVRYQQASTV